MEGPILSSLALTMPGLSLDERMLWSRVRQYERKGRAPNQGWIAEDLGVNVRNISRWKQKLVESGFLANTNRLRTTLAERSERAARRAIRREAKRRSENADAARREILDIAQSDPLYGMTQSDSCVMLFHALRILAVHLPAPDQLLARIIEEHQSLDLAEINLALDYLVEIRVHWKRAEANLYGPV